MAICGFAMKYFAVIALPKIKCFNIYFFSVELEAANYINVQDFAEVLTLRSFHLAFHSTHWSFRVTKVLQMA